MRVRVELVVCLCFAVLILANLGVYLRNQEREAVALRRQIQHLEARLTETEARQAAVEPALHRHVPRYPTILAPQQNPGAIATHGLSGGALAGGR